MSKIRALAIVDKKKFEAVLADNGYFWDINRLHDRFCYDQTFSPADIKRRWRDFFRTANPGGAVSVDFYLHIPFCLSKCEYCLFFRSKFLASEKVEAYLDCLIRQFKYFSPVFRQRQFRHLYIGGGTPNMLGDKQLHRLLTAVFENFSFSSTGQRTMETNPHTARASYFRLLRKFGFNRVSFGVQSLNQSALKTNKREYQSEARIVAAIKMARAAGLADINVDLIAGLAGDSAEGFLYSFARLAQLAPNNIVVYGLMPPGEHYLKDLLNTTRQEYFMNNYPRLMNKVLPLLAKLSARYGYKADSLDPARWHWGFRHKQHLQTDMRGDYGGEFSGCIFGLGHGARSRIHTDIEYRELVNLDNPSAAAAVFEGRLSNRREEMIKFVINRLDQRSILPGGEFFKIFQTRLDSAFPYAIAALKALGRIKETPEGWKLIFKLPSEKYVDALYFFSGLNTPKHSKKPGRG